MKGKALAPPFATEDLQSEGSVTLTTVRQKLVALGFSANVQFCTVNETYVV